MKKIIKAIEKEIEYIVDKRATNEFNSGKKAGLELAIDIINEVTPAPQSEGEEKTKPLRRILVNDVIGYDNTATNVMAGSYLAGILNELTDKVEELAENARRREGK